MSHLPRPRTPGVLKHDPREQLRLWRPAPEPAAPPPGSAPIIRHIGSEADCTVPAPHFDVLAAAPGPSVDTISPASDDLQELVFRHGEYFDSYLATEPGRLSFRSQDGEGLISYVRRGRHVLVGGGLIAAASLRASLLREFVEF